MKRRRHRNSDDLIREFKKQIKLKLFKIFVDKWKLRKGKCFFNTYKRRE